MVVVVLALGFSTRPKASPAPEDVPPRLTYSTQVIGDCDNRKVKRSGMPANSHTYFKHI